jgi:hypothetical protein
MKFKQFLNELADPMVSQVIVSDEPTDNSVGNSVDSINDRLEEIQNTPFESISDGLSEITKVLFDYGINMNQVDDIEEEGDEFFVDLDETNYLYVVYAQNDDGLYDFYAEVVDEDQLEEILEDEDEPED